MLMNIERLVVVENVPAQLHQTVGMSGYPDVSIPVDDCRIDAHGVEQEAFPGAVFQARRSRDY